MVTIQQGLREDGVEVSMVKRCRWFSVARRNVYYRPTKAAAQGACGAARADQGHDRGRAIVRLSHDGGVAGREQEHGAAHLPAEGLADTQTTGGLPAADRGVALSCHGTGSALVHPICAGPGAGAMVG